MTSWLDLYIPKGVYVSQVFDVGSHYETYIQDLKVQYERHDGTVDVFIRLSYDSTNWTEWIKMNEAAFNERDLFRDSYYDMEQCSLQYKVVLRNEGTKSPEFRGISFSLLGTYLLTNTGDVTCKPELWITKRNGAGTIKLTNETNGQILQLADLNNNEQVYIDCENEDIVSDLPLVYRYDKHNNVFLELEVGDNLLTGEGDFELTIRHEYITLQG